MEDEAYEIIYDKGVPVIAFQICTETEAHEEEEEEIDNYIHPQSNINFGENQTLQYFKEDETEKVNNQLCSAYRHTSPPVHRHVRVENKKSKKSNELSSVDRGNLDFVIVKNATKCNSKKLYDALGYSYTLRSVSVKEGCSLWRCRYRVDDKECGAKIKITTDEQLVMLKNHRHPPDNSISFPLLKQTRTEPPKPKTKISKPLSKSVSKIAQKSPKLAKSPKLKHPHKPPTIENTHNSEECEKILDYFSERHNLESSDDIHGLFSEQEEDNGSSSEDGAAATTKENQIAFKVIKNGSLTGTHILYDSLGYSYNVIERKGPKTIWRCQAVLSTEGKECGAKVSQIGSEFSILGLHSHSPKRHTLLKINKMEIFSSQNKTSPDKPIKRKSAQKVMSPKKIKKGRDSLDESPLTVHNIKKENNDESFEFNTKDISFTVSLENDENEPTEEGNVEVETEELSDHNFDLRKSPKKRQKGKVLLSRTVPHIYKEESFSTLKDMALRVFSSSSYPTGNIKYHVIENGSSQGGPKLYDSRGYFYTIRNNPPADVESKTNWFCCSRGEKYNCRAKVIQMMADFTVERDHCHPPDKEKFIRSLIRMEAVEMIKDPSNLRRSGMNIVKGIMDSYGIDFPFNINVDHLVRFVNYQKKSFMEHNEISNYRYTFNKKKIPKNFLLDKIMTDYKFHLTFGTENQLAYLAAATEWYIDEADFDVAPFTNLFSIHVYTHHQDQPHQIPVFFALISERRESDYTQVFTSIKSALNNPPSVTSVIIDLNIPLRRSISKSFPDAEIKCCDLHWSEDISNKLKEMDLWHYFDDPGLMNYLYQLPLLNLLPRQDFETALRKIEREIKDDSVQDLICYIRETFGERSLWTPKYWSSFKMPIRINDHEQWRKDIVNNNTSGELESYSFIRTLYLLSKPIGDDLRLMSKKKIKKHYLTRPETTLCKVYQEWKSYCKGEKNCHKLLEKLASIIHTF